jgi:hypothetical protein
MHVNAAVSKQGRWGSRGGCVTSRFLTVGRCAPPGSVHREISRNDVIRLMKWLPCSDFKDVVTSKYHATHRRREVISLATPTNLSAHQQQNRLAIRDSDKRSCISNLAFIHHSRRSATRVKTELQPASERSSKCSWNKARRA